MNLRNIIIGGAILSIVVGFTLGKTLLADSPAPGSSDDPVVSKSYVDKALQERITDLEKQVAELSVQAQALQTTINELQSKVNKIPSTKPSTNTGGGTPTPNTPGTGGSTQTGSAVGKVCYVQESNNYVNLRSGPSTNDDIVKKVNKGEPMGIEKEENQWYQVKLGDGTVGWVANWVVDIK